MASSPGEWSATVTLSPWPGRPDTMTMSSVNPWPVKRQAQLWSKCPGAVSVEFSGPDGQVIAKWDREAGWTT